MGRPDVETLGSVLEGLEQEGALEQALALLKQSRPDPRPWGEVLARLKAGADRSRARRMSLWQADPRRRTLRLRYQVTEPVQQLHPPAQVALLAKALMDAGLPVALGLEKNPRPAVRLGHPLPLGVPGLSEWADVSLQEPPAVAMDALPALVNAQAPLGLLLLEALLVPNHASPVADLCAQAHWRWVCPLPAQERAKARVDAFLAADRFPMEKAGKLGGQKTAKVLDIRPLIPQMAWEGECLDFATRLAPGDATNPRKLLAAILGIPAEEVLGLCRTRVALAEDPRLQDPGRFEPKLHNMYEDAVLLDSGGNVTLVDEDDDEPLVLG